MADILDEMRRRPQGDWRITQFRYPVLIAPLSEADSGGFSATVPDPPGCMSDGEPPEEAIANVPDAIEEWIGAARNMGRPVPAPSRKARTA